MPMHVALRMPPPPNAPQSSATKMLEAPRHHDRAQTVATESINGSETAPDEQIPMAYWDPLQAAIIDSSYSTLPGKGLVDLLGQGHYATDFGGRIQTSDFNRVGPDFVF